MNDAINLIFLMAGADGLWTLNTKDERRCRELMDEKMFDFPSVDRDDFVASGDTTQHTHTQKEMTKVNVSLCLLYIYWENKKSKQDYPFNFCYVNYFLGRNSIIIIILFFFVYSFDYYFSPPGVDTFIKEIQRPILWWCFFFF